jgi:hypothetical protein
MQKTQEQHTERKQHNNGLPSACESSVSCLASIKGPGYSSTFLVDLFVPKIKLREREHVNHPTDHAIWPHHWMRQSADNTAIPIIIEGHETAFNGY